MGRRPKFCRHNASSTRVMSALPNPWQCSWFWETYNKAFEWKHRHEAAYWQARTIALEFENNLLHQYVQNLNLMEGVCEEPTAFAPYNFYNTADTSHHPIHYDQPCNQYVDSHESMEYADQEFDLDDDEGVEVSQEMIEFMKKSFEHKRRMKRQKAEEKLTGVRIEGTTINSTKNIYLGDEAPTNCQEAALRIKAKQEMYGAVATKLIGMETKMQILFDGQIDGARLWPIIPLNFNM